jgi:protein-S-isoprenylcysteine O-methyltransferase Ste14
MATSQNAIGTAPFAAAVTQSAAPRKLKKRVAIFAVIFIPVAFLAGLSAPKIPYGAPSLFLEAVAWVFFFLYSFIRFWSTMYIGSRKSRELQTDGPYSICRNPLYLGSLCFALAIVMFLTSLTLLVAVLVVAMIYIFNVIPREEYMLRKNFGAQFESYAAQTPRLLPRISLYRAGETVNVSLKGMHREATYQALSLVIMLLIAALYDLRYQSWWPHYINLP